jgi:hypothetical protein
MGATNRMGFGASSCLAEEFKAMFHNIRTFEHISFAERLLAVFLAWPTLWMRIRRRRV